MTEKYLIKKGILFFDGEEFQTRLKKAKYYTIENAIKTKNKINQKKVSIIDLTSFQKMINNSFKSFEARHKKRCSTKVGYSSKKRAIHCRNKLGDRVGKKDVLTTYKCSHCLKWHNGTIDGYALYYGNLKKDLKFMGLWDSDEE